MPSKPRPVEIEWYDIVSSTGEWQEPHKALELKPVLCNQTGYIVHEAPEYIVITDSYMLGGYGCLTAIPRGCIVKPKRLCKKI